MFKNILKWFTVVYCVLILSGSMLGIVKSGAVNEMIPNIIVSVCIVAALVGIFTKLRFLVLAPILSTIVNFAINFKLLTSTGSTLTGAVIGTVIPIIIFAALFVQLREK